MLIPVVLGLQHLTTNIKAALGLLFLLIFTPNIFSV